MGNGDNIPGNVQNTVNTSANITATDWLITIIIILAILLIIAVSLFVVYYNKAKKLQNYTKDNVTDEERNLILKYRNLNPRDKNIINNTLKTLDDNNQSIDNQDGGN